MKNRSSVLAAHALACVLLAGLAALYTFTESLPPSDGAYGTPVWELLLDPFVLVLWLPLVFSGTAIGFAFAVWLLREVDLRRAVPTVAAVTVLGTAAAAPVSVLLSWLVGLVAGILAMGWCRTRPGWKKNGPTLTGQASPTQRAALRQA